MHTHLSFQYVKIFSIFLSKLTGADIHTIDRVNWAVEKSVQF